MGGDVQTEHPRVGGEDADDIAGNTKPCGTPLHRRGGRAAVRRGAAEVRDTFALVRRMPCGRWARSGGRESLPRRQEDRLNGYDLTFTFGTSLRWRGGRVGVRTVADCRRNTPASAGRTLHGVSRRGGAAEHPRVGGEDRPVSRPICANTGTPPRRGRDLATELSAIDLRGTLPRRRGGHRVWARDPETRRNTPASAGRTTNEGQDPACSAEHPRVGGEDIGMGGSGSVRGGTPPRRRGGRRWGSERPRHRRNTPASAGRTRARGRNDRGVAEHPRVGGEDALFTFASGASDGTPPRRRGGRSPRGQQPSRGRNTPASAGRTKSSTTSTCSSTEYPRVGGEDGGATAADTAAGGTPLRRRGGPVLVTVDVRAARNTPASAGRTGGPPLVHPRTTEHPRVGGRTSR